MTIPEMQRYLSRYRILSKEYKEKRMSQYDYTLELTFLLTKILKQMQKEVNE